MREHVATIMTSNSAQDSLNRTFGIDSMAKDSEDEERKADHDLIHALQERVMQLEEDKKRSETIAVEALGIVQQLEARVSHFESFIATSGSNVHSIGTS